jgi:NRAMP (natural resistance-associated macrophage protein)-like metal ion transporter
MEFLKRLKNIGPGAMVAAAFIGPGTVTTATMAGAGYGYTLLWAILFSVFATVVLQEMSARLGVIGEMGVGEAVRKKIQNRVLFTMAAVLVISAILIGNAAYEAGNISGAVLGFGKPGFHFQGIHLNPLVLLTGLLAFSLLFSGKYKFIERSLVVMVGVMGFVFMLSAILLKPDLLSMLKGMFVPALPEKAFLVVIGLIGTTVVPYNLFLHAAAVRQKWQGENDLHTARSDTYISVIFGGIITMCILLTAAAAYEGQERTIKSAAEISQALLPVLGDWSLTFIATGFLAAGLSSAITAPLAAAFATSEVLGWEKNLKGIKFRFIWLAVLTTGLVFSSLGFSPTQVILFAQVANGLLLPIVATFLLWVMNDKKIMVKYANSLWSNIIGGAVILITLLLGLKGIITAINQ